MALYSYGLYVTAYVVMPYIVIMALCSYGLYSYGPKVVGGFVLRHLDHERTTALIGGAKQRLAALAERALYRP